MATGYTNTVPLGREGTGAAQILGPNRALQYVLQQNKQREDRLLREQQRYQQNQEGYNRQFQKTLFEMGELAQTPMFREDFAELTNELVRQGGELMSQGVNPFNPYQSEGSRGAVQQWTADYNRLRAAKGIVDNLYKERQKQVDNYLKNPQDYDFDEFKELKDFEKNNSLEDILDGGASLPQLSQRLNIGTEIGKQFGDISRDIQQDTVDEAGNPITVTGKEADVDRIMGIVENQFTPRTQYGQEVNRRLRREFGEGASMDGLLGITNRDEIRDILDAEFRNPSDNNPLVELMSNGINARPGTPAYESFLEQATNEQLRAEMILDEAKQEAANALVQRVNPTRRQKYDFTLRNQQLREQSARSLEQSRALQRQNTALSIQKKLAGGDDVADAMIDEAVDVNFADEWDADDPEANPITAWGVIPQSPSSVTINPSNTIDVKTGQQVKSGEIRGSISGFGLVALDANGNVVNGSSPESLAKDPRVVRFAPKVVVQDNDRTSHLYDVKSMPISSLTKEKRENAQKAISVQQKTADELNEQLKSRPKQGDQQSNDWQRYNNGLSDLFSSPAPATRNSVSTKKVINW